MASETPGGERRARRPDSRSADKYYASKDRSVIQGTGERTSAVAKPTALLPHPQDRSADKYYRHGPVPKQTGKPAGVVQRPHRLQRESDEAHAVAPRDALYVSRVEDIPAVLQELTLHLRGGAKGITIEIKDVDLRQRTRTALDFMVTRETITEDQYSEVLLVVANPPVAFPVAASTADAEPVTDSLGFLTETAAHITDPVTTVPDQKEEFSEEDEPIVTATVPTVPDFLDANVSMAPAVDLTLSEEPERKKRGKRSGRGS